MSESQSQYTVFIQSRYAGFEDHTNLFSMYTGDLKIGFSKCYDTPANVVVFVVFLMFHIHVKLFNSVEKRLEILLERHSFVVVKFCFKTVFCESYIYVVVSLLLMMVATLAWHIINFSTPFLVLDKYFCCGCLSWNCFFRFKELIQPAVFEKLLYQFEKKFSSSCADSGGGRNTSLCLYQFFSNDLSFERRSLTVSGILLIILDK